MKARLDWKDVATGYYEKSITLAVLFMLFSFMVTPEIQVKPYEGGRERLIEAYIPPPEVKQEIKPPAETKKPVIDIVIEDEVLEEEMAELDIIDTIGETTIEDMFEEVAPPPEDDVPERFVIYDEAPVPIKKVAPKYTDFARRSGIEGTVMVDVVVKADGSVGQVNIVKSLMAGVGGLDEEAIKAVKQWEFQPAKSNGKPVAVWVTFPVNFSLRN